MQSVNGTPLIVGDSLYFYSSGRRLNKIMWDSYTFTGLVTLRRDGFVSLQSADNKGYLVTRKVSFNGDYLFLNANINKGGELRVEVLDVHGNIIKGFTRRDCVPMKVNSTKYKIRWKNNANLSSLANIPVQFKFYLNNGELYSFWVSPWETGESRGYTAGGGPQLNPLGIDAPAK